MEPSSRGTTALRGRLVADDGARLSDPRVWLIPKGTEGLRVWYDVPALGEVDANGGWTMQGDPRGRWIAGLAGGYRPVFSDGDAWTGQAVELRLKRGRPIEVGVAVDGDGVEPGVVAYVKPEGDAAYDYPGPDAEPSMATWSILGSERSAVVYASTSRTVRVTLMAKGFVTTPPWIDLGPDEDHAAFQLTRGCRIALRLLDAETGFVLSDLEAAVVVESLDRSGEDRYRDLTEFVTVATEIGFLPGRYRLGLDAEGYAAWRSDVLTLSRPGQHIELDARLVPREGFGRLLLEMVPPPGGTLEGAVLSALCGRPDEHGRFSWTPWAVHGAGEDRRRFLLAPTRAGDVHLLAWTGRAAVGWLAGTPLRAGETRPVRLELVRGTFVRLASIGPAEGFFFGGGTASIRLEAPDGTPLPAAWFESRQAPLPGARGWWSSNHGFREERVTALLDPRADAVLGPYPFSSVVVSGAHASLEPNGE